MEREYRYGSGDDGSASKPKPEFYGTPDWTASDMPSNGDAWEFPVLYWKPVRRDRYDRNARKQ